MAAAPIPSRGDIWLVDFDPSVDAEIRKIRPALVVSLDAIGRLPLRIIVPITTGSRSIPAFRGSPRSPLTQRMD